MKQDADERDDAGDRGHPVNEHFSLF
jgi:hypothetical protein